MPTEANLPAFIHTPEGLPGGLAECRCSTCAYRVRVHSHPWYDGLPVSNIVAYGCTVQLALRQRGQDAGEPMITLMALTNDIGCELHTPPTNDFAHGAS